MKAKKFDTFEEFDFEPGSYVLVGKDFKDVFMTLPCGHNFRPQGKWELKDIEDQNKITLSPSIFCKGSSGNPCWHGYLRNGEFIKA